ncbi:hypothetical protein [Hymenobacter negativus]|nr:hypothetical protein [Hymenobacter negativus]
MIATACQRAPYRYQPLPDAAATTSVGTTPQLLFLSFRMSTAATGTHQLEPLMLKATPGQANPAADDEEPSGTSYLLLSQLDAANAPCGPSRKLPHPLLQDVEAPAAPGTGAMQRHTISLAQAEFFVRVARQPKARAVRLEEVGPAAISPISVTFPLPN